MNFLEITMFYYPTGGGASSTTHSMVSALCTKGHNVSLVYPIFSNSPTLLSDKKREVPNLKLCPVYIPSKFSFRYLKIYDPLTRYDAYKHIFEECKKILDNGNIDYIISHFHESTSIGNIGDKLSELYHIPHIVKVHDINPFVGINPDIIYSVKNYFTNKKVFKNSYKIVFPNRSMKEKAIERYDLNKDKTLIVPNGYFIEKRDEKIYKKIDTIPGINTGINSRMKLVFVGGLYRNRKLDNLLCALEKMTIKPHLFVVGDGPKRNEFIKLAKEKGLDKYITMCGNLSNEKMMEVLKDSHIGIGIIDKSAMSELQMPIKIIDYMSAGLPWIAMEHKGIVELNESNSGIILKDGSVNEIKKSIEIFGNKEIYIKMSNAGYDYVFEKLNWHKNIDILLDILDNDN